MAPELRRVLIEHLAWLWQKHPGMIGITSKVACGGWLVCFPRGSDYGLTEGDLSLRSMEYDAEFSRLSATTGPYNR
ncbi:hypothetical protein F4778DRAFT_785920 [Xylariomycetidae sp. FL2044]|nr:hypothetical protein F4778DRAFT_785920 [Xylariomycetidae sp. FL2044]